MRRYRSISDYLSLGAGAHPMASKSPTPLLEVKLRQGPRAYTKTDTLSAERITVQHLRDSAAMLVRERVPPIRHVRYINGYLAPEDGGPVMIKQGGSIPEGAEPTWHEPLPGAAEFGPYYEVNLPPADMTALCGDPEFQAGEAAGEFRVAGKGIIMIRPPEPP
jgi:hypothetical protein